MKILFIHQNFPGQFKHSARVLAQDPDNEVYFITNPKSNTIPGVKKVSYKVSRQPNKETHKYLIGFEKAIFAGQEVWRVCKKLKDEYDFYPDVIVAHPGWGEAMFVKDIFPEAPLLNFVEFFYRAYGADLNYEPGSESLPDDLARIRVKNSNNLISLEACDWAISPTFWQASHNPKEFYGKISVIHDGVDTDYLTPRNEKTLTVGGHIFNDDEEIITYVARNFEPYRGFDKVMKAIEIVMKERPKAKFLMIGSDGVSYGASPKSGKTFKQEMLEEVELDSDRIFWLGSLEYSKFVEVLAFSKTHIYMTVPFVLSWSLIEAMSLERLLVVSNTAPVLEVVEDGVNGIVADFFSIDDIAEKIIYAAENRNKLDHIRQNARKTAIAKFDLKKLLPLHVNLIKDLAEKKLPPPTAREINKLYKKEELLSS